jgi:hypothetical protein
MSKVIPSQDLAAVAGEKAVLGGRRGEEDRGEVGTCRLWMRFVQTKEYRRCVECCEECRASQ